MKKNHLKRLWAAGSFFVAFVLWTVAVSTVDVRPIGPQDSLVGFATVNGFIHNVVGVHIPLYVITDWLGLLPLGFAVGFAILGLAQWIKRKSIKKVDYSIFVIGSFYVAVMMAYLLFESVVINYRPVLIDGSLEASYPSSTTMLVMCVMPTAIMQLNSRIKNGTLRRCARILIDAFIVFMVAARFISGVHWFTDIVGGALLSVGLVLAYGFVSGLKTE